MNIKFGTDGWRGLIADDFTFENVRRCTQGLADFLSATGNTKGEFLVGFDTRFLSRNFAETVSGVLAGNGIKVKLANQPAPTPVISFNTMKRNVTGAVIITASHNPFDWNGLKIKMGYGGSPTEETMSDLEKYISGIGSVKTAPLSSNLIDSFDPRTPYINHISKFLDLRPIRNSQLNILCDPMFGAGSGYLPLIVNGTRASVSEIRNKINPVFPGMHQPEPVFDNLRQLSKLVIKQNADVGIAYDGDADRLGIVDEKGDYISTLHVFSLLALYLLEVRKMKGPIVKSITSSDMLFKLGELYNVPIYETKIGFKNIGPVMLEKDALIGGEESGGYGYRGHIPERDGILSSLLFLDFMIKLEMSPAKLIKYLHNKVGEHYYMRKDIKIDSPAKYDLAKNLISNSNILNIGKFKVLSSNRTDGLKLNLKEGWLAIRLSGTEPLLRVYAESNSISTTQYLVQNTRQLTDLTPGG